MPRTPVDYSKTLIYKLVHKEDYDNANIYVGSTTDFRKRKNNHKSSCSNEKNEDYNDKKYQYIRDNGGWECFNMIEVEKYPCNDGNEARAREEYWRCYFNSQLNTKRAYRTDEQRIERYKKYYENNKDTHNKYTKEHYQKNKDKLLEKITCECGCMINKGSLTQHLKTQKHLTKIGVLKYEFVDDNDDN
jgi:hypothetical protein